MKRQTVLCLPLIFCLMGCDELIPKAKDQPSAEQAPLAPKQPVSTPSERFVFPAKSGPFPESSVALDTTSGTLCKTFAWQDNGQVPKGLPLCSELSRMQIGFVGASKAYRGSSYKFNGTKWVKGANALKYNEKTKDMDPLSEDQYDPLNLLSKEEKAKRLLTMEEIRIVANQFGVSIEEAWEDAKAQGYQVPPPMSSFEKH